MSIANDIALAVSARLQTITVTNGYATDIGLKVMRGRKRLDPSQLPCAVLIERDDKPDKQSGQRDPSAKISQVYVLEGHAACDADNPNDMGHMIIADIKKAIFSSKLTYGSGQQIYEVTYAGRTIAPREDGMAVVAAAVEISVDFVERLANP